MNLQRIRPRGKRLCKMTGEPLPLSYFDPETLQKVADGILPERVGYHLGPFTKLQHPYSYDPILQFKKVNTLPKNASAVYSDRMWQDDYSKYRRLCLQHFQKGNDPGGDWFGSRSPASIEAFLRDFYDDPGLELLRVEEHCHRGNGFPLWVFFFTHTVGWTAKPKEIELPPESPELTKTPGA